MFLARALVADWDISVSSVHVLVWLMSGEPLGCGDEEEDPGCICPAHLARRWLRKHRDEYARRDAKGGGA